MLYFCGYLEVRFMIYLRFECSGIQRNESKLGKTAYEGNE